MTYAYQQSLRKPTGSLIGKKSCSAYPSVWTFGLCGILLLFAVSFVAIPAAAQSSGNPGLRSLDPSQINQRFPDKTIFMSQDQVAMTQELKRVRLMNVARQRAMVEDAEKLLKLANELNSNMADGTELTAAQRAHKADEIEKLARDVKDKMTFVFSGDASPQTPLGSWPQ